MTGGSQGKGKFNIGQSKSPKTYTEGVVQGEKNMAKRIKHLFDLHLDYKPKKEQIRKMYDILDNEVDWDIYL